LTVFKVVSIVEKSPQSTKSAHENRSRKGEAMLCGTKKTQEYVNR